MPATKNSSAASLHKIIAEAQAALSAMGINIETTNETKTKTKKGGKTKAAKAEGVKGRGTAWAAFTAKMKLEKAGEFNAYMIERLAKAEAGQLFYTADQDAVKLGRAVAGEPIPVKKAKIGAHLSWMSAYKKERVDVWKAYETEWNASNPKSAPTSSAASVAEAESEAESEASAPIVQPKKRGAKKIADIGVVCIHQNIVSSKNIAIFLCFSKRSSIY
jgi:hypothetical protein